MVEWYVYRYNINRRKIEKHNVFEHASFIKYLKQHLKECNELEELEERIKSELRYYYWSKAEWEVLVTPWVGGNRDRDAVKIDVFNQVMLNWDVFMSYICNNKEEILKMEN